MTSGSSIRCERFNIRRGLISDCLQIVPQEPERVTDMQNVQLADADKGWTTRNKPEGRNGGTYGAPHGGRAIIWRMGG